MGRLILRIARAPCKEEKKGDGGDFTPRNGTGRGASEAAPAGDGAAPCMEPPLDSRRAARRHDHKVAGLRRTLSSDPADAASDAAPPTVRGRTHLESFKIS